MLASSLERIREVLERVLQMSVFPKDVYYFDQLPVKLRVDFSRSSPLRRLFSASWRRCIQRGMPHGLTLWKFFDMNRGTSHPSAREAGAKGLSGVAGSHRCVQRVCQRQHLARRLKRGLHLRSVGGDAGDCRAFGLR